VAISRGTHDRVADALWLTGAATPQPFVPDLPGRWRAAGHVVVVLPVDGLVSAVVESEELRAVADEVVVASDLIEAAARAVPRGGRVGVLGADAMPFAWWSALAERAVLEDADDLGRALRRTKSAAEQRLLREAGRLGAEAMAAALAALRPGVVLADVARACETALAASAHARRHGVPEHLMGGYWGHGLGLGFEPPWIGPDSREVVEPGWCLAVERRAAVPGVGGAQYEDDVLIGPDGAEVLTGCTLAGCASASARPGPSRST
jgi:Xaa-Pro aminopeptidase